MSRIGKKPIPIPSGVDVKIQNTLIEVKGPKGSVQVPLHSRIKVAKQENNLVCERSSEQKEDKALHGTMRSLVANAVTGVTQGFKKEFDIVGIGYRAALDKKKLVLTLGFSHPVEVEVPQDMQVTFDEKNKNRFVVSGVDKQRVGQFSAQLRSIRPPDPYKGKGLKYADEQLKLKEGKKKA